MNKLLILAGGCIILASCKQNKSANETADIQYKGDTVYVAENSKVNSKIKIYTVAEQDYSAEFNTTGTVKAIAGQIAEIAPPFDGRIGKSFIKLGQRIIRSPIIYPHSTFPHLLQKNIFRLFSIPKYRKS